MFTDQEHTATLDPPRTFDPILSPPVARSILPPSPIVRRFSLESFEVTSPAACVVWLRAQHWRDAPCRSNFEAARLTFLDTTAVIYRDCTVVIIVDDELAASYSDGRDAQ